MKAKLTVIVIIAIAAVAGIVAQRSTPPPIPAPPNAFFVECVNGVFEARNLPTLIEEAEIEGCKHTTIDAIYDGFYLVRSSKIVIAN